MKSSYFDQVNLHRSALIGYQGVINMVTEICNRFSRYLPHPH